jgi:hypothetical protein
MKLNECVFEKLVRSPTPSHIRLGSGSGCSYRSSTIYRTLKRPYLAHQRMKHRFTCASDKSTHIITSVRFLGIRYWFDGV